MGELSVEGVVKQVSEIRDRLTCPESSPMEVGIKGLKRQRWEVFRSTLIMGKTVPWALNTGPPEYCENLKESYESLVRGQLGLTLSNASCNQRDTPQPGC